MMKKTVFFSWQSDMGVARNKLTRALDIVVRDLGKTLEESNRPELDSDTKGKYGSVDILNTIFSKIDACSIFVADVTPIVKKGKKLIPNPNVMAEVGYAIKAKSESSRLFIYCTDKPIDIDKMPFDIKVKSLIGFTTDQKPSDIAKTLISIIGGMLENDTIPNKSKAYLSIYVSAATVSHWADGETTALTITNAENETYFLESISIGNDNLEVNRSLPPGAVIKGLTFNKSLIPFEKANPTINIRIAKGDYSLELEQEIKTSSREDGKFNVAQYIERAQVLKEEKF